MRLRLAIALATLAATTVAAIASGCTSEAGGDQTVTVTVSDDTSPPPESEPVSSPETTSTPAGEKPPKTLAVAAVVDGDTIKLKNGQSVRLLQIDAPEPSEGECYSRKAGSVLRKMLPEGTRVTMQADPKLDKRDQYDRLLRYVFVDGKNVNVELVKRGAASVWFYQGERGRYANQLMRAVENAKANERGLWQACRGTALDPLHAIEATSALPEETVEPSLPVDPQPPEESAAPGADCDPSYPDFCIPPGTPDLDCADVPYTNFVVRPPDPHGFDGNNDGYGCEG